MPSEEEGQPLILQEDEYGWCIIDPRTGEEVACLTTSYYTFMEAWMAAPLGKWEVRSHSRS